MTRNFLFSVTLVATIAPTLSFGQTNAPSIPNPNIYPAKPYEQSFIEARMRAITEGQSYINNVHVMESKWLNRRKTKTPPWGGPFWALNQGMIANPYQERDYNAYIFDPLEHVSWKSNVNEYKERKLEVHPHIYDLSEKELAKLAPSEKYDLLLGDTSFDLTNRIWNYAERWGSEKNWGFLTSIDLPDGYKIPDANSLMAMWEGICHGWAVASGHSPRPEKTVWVTLPNGKKMPFFPNDIKALVSLMWAHSNIQSNVIFEGNRCNQKNPPSDAWGRLIDLKKDRYDTELLPRCADTHPAIFHMAIVNILGVEGRSFVVDHDPKAAIANQPVAGYDLDYFHPKTGKINSVQASMVPVESYDEDPYRDNRSPNARYIIGVAMKLKYVDWEIPRKKETNTEDDDRIVDMKFNYDLELDEEGNIVGGQWRVNKNASAAFGKSPGQPDFFWIVPRNWKDYFQPMKGLPSWDFERSTLPPQEYQRAAHGAHSFQFEESEKYLGYSPQCRVLPIGGGEEKRVDCTFKYPRPQPLIQIVDKLLEESRK